MRLVIFISIFALVEIYAFKGLRSMSVNMDPMWRRIISYAFWLTTLVSYGFLTYMMVSWSRREDALMMRDYGFFNFVIGFFLLCFTTKLFFGTFHLLNDIVNLGKWAVLKLSQKPESLPHEGMTRVQFFNQVGLGVAALWAGSMLYGMTRGKFGYRVLTEKLTYPDLPASFDGLRIVQISDMHIGSFNEDFEDVQKGFDMINALEPDYLFFTGDLVNNFSDEAEPWIERLKGLKAKYGKFSILGNHDYGDYAMGDFPEAKAKSFNRLTEIHREAGFRLLRNENVALERNGEKIMLLGSENWGLGFHQYGDLEKTLSGTTEADFKILLSHDPTHWQEHVIGHDVMIHNDAVRAGSLAKDLLPSNHNIALTLSGHTHGAQMGLEIPQFGIKFSPVSIRYKRWGGLYSEAGKYLYINRGFGFLGFPGRVGMAPEITLLELHRG